MSKWSMVWPVMVNNKTYHVVKYVARPGYFMMKCATGRKYEITDPTLIFADKKPWLRMTGNLKRLTA